jgi:hypothetical protein
MRDFRILLADPMTATEAVPDRSGSSQWLRGDGLIIAVGRG